MRSKKIRKRKRTKNWGRKGSGRSKSRNRRRRGKKKRNMCVLRKARKVRMKGRFSCNWQREGGKSVDKHRQLVCA